MHPKNTTIRFQDGHSFLITLVNDEWATADIEFLELLTPHSWSLTGNGYARAVIDGRPVMMHRLIMGAPEGVIVDHINWNRLDNRRSNLRFANKRLNAANTGLNAKNTSGYKGVRPSRDGRKWVAFISARGRYRHLGTFKFIEDAARAYDAAAIEAYGDFAHINLPHK